MRDMKLPTASISTATEFRHISTVCITKSTLAWLGNTSTGGLHDLHFCIAPAIRNLPYTPNRKSR
jgi:hypothetical protein